MTDSIQPELSSTDDDAPVAEARAAAAARRKKKRGVCVVTGKRFPKKDLFPLAMLRPSLLEQLRRTNPDIDPDGQISRAALNRLRGEFVEDILKGERGELSSLERDVIESLERHETLSEDTEREWDTKRTVGEMMADGVASFGGSWSFILSFGFFIVVWMLINVAMGERQAFDAYPFILLNLVLSCLAAIQAPVIMMSQKRQESKDRLRSQNDYRVNLKAELEIRHLHEKVDHLLNKQWERLTEIQEIQLELLQDIAAEARRARKQKRPARPGAAQASALEEVPS